MKSKKIMAMTAVVGAMVLTGCATQANVSPEAVGENISTSRENCIGGFETIWNSTPVDGDASELPQEIVTVVSETGRIFDAMRRTPDGTAEAVAPEDINYKVHVDDSWPKNNVIVIDTATDKVLDTINIPDGKTLCD
jgi:DNA-binding beta-propeller fold protein YncE